MHDKVLKYSSMFQYVDLKSEQWTLAEDLVKVLGPFFVATTYFSQEVNISDSVSSVFPVLHGLVEQL